ncbi:MAG: polysaccharide biosynthesis tyrosine autokinase [Anaerolineales bacterium]
MILNDYLQPIIRWWRLIATVTILAVSASAISALFQPDIYVSRTTLVVGQTFLDPNPNSNQFIIGQQLAVIYADMALREPIQLATMQALGIDWLPEYQARVVPNTQMVEISVTDTNPQRAQIITHELASQLIQQSPTIGETQTGEQQDFIKQQLANLRSQIEETERAVAELQQSLAGLTSASQIANIERQIGEQTQKLDSLRTTYAAFLANSQEGAVNILTPVEPASLPTRPTGANKILMIILAGMVAASLGIGAAYLLEYLDKTIKTTADVERIFHLPVIGYISEISEDGNKASHIVQNPDSVVAENFRMLQSNIDFFRVSNPIKTILITSPSQGNGKTTVASNLALSLSQAEDDVVLVDADLRRPAVHHALEMSEGPGIYDVINNKTDLESALRDWKSEQGLKVVTAGTKQQNVTEVIGSKKLATILSDLAANHELVIIDAPPLIIADSYNLASRADGVIIVMEPGQTSNDQAKAIKEQLNRAGAKIVGIVFNKVSEAIAVNLGDLQYQSLYAPKYYGDYVGSKAQEPSSGARSKKLMDFFEHGKVPDELATDVQSAITAIKTQPRNMLNRIKKSKANGKSA